MKVIELKKQPGNSACYSCKHRQEVPGSAHSMCICPTAQKNAFVALALLMKGVGRKSPANGVLLNEHGVRNGWANWPIDFDPVWVEQCNHFESNKTEQ